MKFLWKNVHEKEIQFDVTELLRCKASFFGQLKIKY